jgi:hypothetical protein
MVMIMKVERKIYLHDYLTTNSLDVMRRISPGKRSPGLKWTMSPGTTSL